MLIKNQQKTTTPKKVNHSQTTLDKWGNPIITSIDDNDFVESVATKFFGKAIHLKTKNVPSITQLEKHKFQFLRYDQDKNDIWYAKRNDSPMPWGPNHVVGAKIVLKCKDNWLLVKDIFGPPKFWFAGGTVQIDGEKRDQMTISNFKGHPLPQVTALQELFEETGLDYRERVDDLKLIANMFFQGVLKRQGQYANDIAFFYLLEVKDALKRKLIIDQKEIKCAEWVKTSDILDCEMTTKATQEIVAHITNAKKPNTKKFERYTISFY